MKTSFFSRFVQRSFIFVCCLSFVVVAFSSCGDDDKDSPSGTDLPEMLFQQWIINGDGSDYAKAVIYDLSKKGRFEILQQPTAEYAAKAEMLPDKFYLLYPFEAEYEIDVKTGVIYLHANMGVYKLTNLTAESVRIDGRLFSAVKEKIQSAGNWRHIDEPL